jgi:hypothetical protein
MIVLCLSTTVFTSEAFKCLATATVLGIVLFVIRSLRALNTPS